MQGHAPFVESQTSALLRTLGRIMKLELLHVRRTRKVSARGASDFRLFRAEEHSFAVGTTQKV